MDTVESVKANISKMEQQIKDWGLALEAMTKKAGADAKAEAKQNVDDARVKYNAASAKLTEFKTAGESKWDTFKQGIETAWKDVEVAFKKATN